MFAIKNDCAAERIHDELIRVSKEVDRLEEEYCELYSLYRELIKEQQIKSKPIIKRIK